MQGRSSQAIAAPSFATEKATEKATETATQPPDQSPGGHSRSGATKGSQRPVPPNDPLGVGGIEPIAVADPPDGASEDVIWIGSEGLVGPGVAPEGHPVGTDGDDPTRRITIEVAVGDDVADLDVGEADALDEHPVVLEEQRIHARAVEDDLGAFAAEKLEFTCGVECTFGLHSPLRIKASRSPNFTTVGAS